MWPWPPRRSDVLRVGPDGQWQLASFSWLFVPVLALAVGRTDLCPAFAAAVPTLPPSLQAAIGAYAALLQRAGVTSATLFGAGSYIGAEQQEALLRCLPLHAQVVQLYGIAYANATLQHQRAQDAEAALQPPPHTPVPHTTTPQPPPATPPTVHGEKAMSTHLRGPPPCNAYICHGRHGPYSRCRYSRPPPLSPPPAAPHPPPRLVLPQPR